jgi:uncharacterized protein (DUF1697 family)
MPCQVAFLRGINVGKAKRVAMADLREVVECLGFKDVRTVLSSGNVVYTCPRLAPQVAGARIHKALAEELGVSSRVIVLDDAELAAVIDANPLAKTCDNYSRLLAFVQADAQTPAALMALAKRTWGKEKLALGPRVAYVWCPNGFMESPLREALGDAVGDAMTSRNWATMLKLAALVTPS